MEYRRQTHAIYYTRFHIVFTTRYRRKILKAGIGSYLSVVMRTIQRRHPELQIYEVSTDLDHIHLLVSIAPKLSVSEAVRIIKSNTARMMVRKFPYLLRVYYDRGGIWSVGYFVSTVGINEETIRRYIAQQAQEDSGQAKLELN